MAFLQILFLFFLSFNLFCQTTNNPCNAGKDQFLCVNSTTISTESLLPGKWSVVQGSVLISSPSNVSTSVSNIQEGITKIIWKNDDNSCIDTVRLIISKIGSTDLTYAGDLSKNGNELILCHNASWQASTSVTVGESYVAYVLYDKQPPVNPDVFKDKEAFPGPVVFVNNDKNNGGILTKYPTSSQSYWFLPVLFNSIGINGPVIDSTCQVTGTPFKITYLSDIQVDRSEDCVNGNVRVSFDGGYPEFYGGNYSLSNPNPVSSYSNLSVNKNGFITISNLSIGDSYSFLVTDQNGCKKSYSRIFPPCPACKLDLSYKKYICNSDTAVFPLKLNGGDIGRLKVVPDSGLVIDTLTGKINGKQSLPGIYQIQNITSESCSFQDTFSLVVNVLSSISAPFGPSVDTLCMNNPKIGDISGVSGQSIKWYSTSGKILNTVSEDAVDLTTYLATQMVKGCESDSLSVFIHAPKVGPPVADTLIHLCYGDSLFVSNLRPAGKTIVWYLNESGGVALTSDAKISEKLFYASQKLACESKDRLKVRVDIDTVVYASVFEDTLFYCYSPDLIIDSLIPKGNQIQWYNTLNDKFPFAKYELLEKGVYYFTLKDSISGCESNRNKVTVQLSNISFLAKKELPFCDANNGKIEVYEVDGGVPPYSYLWSGKDTNSVYINVPEGNISLQITDAKQCMIDTLFRVDCKDFSIPQLITPNKDGINDRWVIDFFSFYPKVQVFVYNRWGKNVFESSIPYMDDWDGGGVPSGTYYYLIYPDQNIQPLSGFLEIQN
jgi:gliding motility-associated-like protein